MPTVMSASPSRYVSMTVRDEEADRTDEGDDRAGAAERHELREREQVHRAVHDEIEDHGDQHGDRNVVLDRQRQAYRNAVVNNRRGDQDPPDHVLPHDRGEVDDDEEDVTEQEADAARHEPLCTLRDQQHVAQPARRQRAQQRPRELVGREDVIQDQQDQQKRLRVPAFRVVRPAVEQVDGAYDHVKREKDVR